jgi:hypothetical protein
VTAVAAPSASVMPLPSAAPAASSGRGVTGTADASPHDDPFDQHFDRHFDRAVRDDRSSRDDRVVARGTDDAGNQRTSEPGTDTETSGRASDREIEPRDDARHPGDSAPVVGVAALLLAVRAEAPTPTEAPVSTEPDTEPATVPATGTVATGTGTSTSMIDVAPADADSTPTPTPTFVMVDGTAVAATHGPSDPVPSNPVSSDTVSSDPVPSDTVPSAAPPASASDPLSGVEITVDASATPSTSAIGIETLGRAALRARVTDSAIDGAVTATATATAASTGAGPSALGTVVADAGAAAETAATESTSPAPTPTPGAESASRRVSFAEAAQAADPAPLSEPTTSSKSEVRAPLSLPSISVDLSDEGLGPMQLQARQGPDGLHLTLTAADREVGAALARAGAELRRDLESAGTTVGSLNVGQGSGDIGQGSGDRAGQRQGRADDGGLRGAPPLGGVTASTTAQPPLITTTRTSSADAGLDLLI